jgi:Leucine-rich repeat (LRR) protein
MNENWFQINNLISKYEQDCIKKLPCTKFDADTSKSMHIITTMYKHNDNSQELNDLIHEQINKLERIIFLNKSVIFIEKSSKYESLCSDSASFGKLLFIQNEHLNCQIFDDHILNDRQLTYDMLKTDLVLKHCLKPQHIIEVMLDLKTLDSVEFSSCNLSSIERNLFADLKDLVSINLSDNQLTHLDDYTFSGLINLCHIDLSGNLITKIQANLFKDLMNLKE